MPETRKHAAIMFTDIVGYTRIMGSDEERAVDMLSRNRSIHQSCIEEFNGTLIKEIGDGILASFSLASEAVRCAIEIQKECKEQNIPLKIGIHEGEMIFSGSDVIGDGVNIASRLQEDAQEGCINISASVYRDIKNKADIKTQLIGEKSFKNVDEPIKVYRVLCGTEKHEEQSIEKQKLKKPVSKLPYYILTGLAVVIVAILLIWKFIPFKENVELEKSIAVLPFKSLSDDPDKQYQADGVMDAITSNLAKISELRVIAKTSVERYRNHSMDVRDIGKEIDVSYIVAGSFQLVGDKARLIIQLINTKDGSNLWSNEYDRDWSDIFKVQSEVSQTIAKEVAVNITPETKEVIETIPTTDLTAYDYYLKGNEYQGLSNNEEDLRDAFQMYEKAVEIDSTFVLAWVGLTSSSRDIYWFYYDRSEEQLIRINKYLDYAISLSPNLKEVQIEEGSYYYQCKLDYPNALRILEPLNAEYPNDPEIYSWIGGVYRRMGEFNNALEYQNSTISLNPSNWRYWLDGGFTLIVLHKYIEAEKYFKRAISLNPSYFTQHNELLRLYARTGQIINAKEYIQNNRIIVDDPLVKFTRAYIEILEGNYGIALKIIESISEGLIINEDYYFTKHLELGLIYHMMSNKEMAVEHFELEKVFLLSKMDKLQNDPRVYQSLGITYAGLGRKKEAIEAGQKALDILSFSNDAFGGYFPEMDMVKILMMVGKYDDALDRLDKIISQNGNITVEILKLDPFWNPIREMDKFKEIISNPRYQIDLSAN